ncbi:MAG: 4Fe-4S dicluster domain-containing protein [Eubacteriales bacterium]|mgnify:FL=1|jgi:2-oxoglutarate ferredoxin oxidoreductase subunit delta|uniref:4Fe-4S dicluster domain-containing protein n=1 Tax=Baileyella intestinalis TaxID=2606709 RepID=UPI0022DEE96B|nr:4Fe-4S dicluster domain-containing protein [Baileyella intestinalis]MDD5875674.1 4Fe-4S dicluster domain-containing protein [Baileyella intestinalis]MDY2994367.1 4Fe-4S dicluster domain-containing protein [Baileyella intestinalis]
MEEKVRVKAERCKGCYLCIANCKPGALGLSGETNGKGVVTVKVDQEKCVKCGSCYAMCPDLVFEIL